jgi:hypothetical protein
MAKVHQELDNQMKYKMKLRELVKKRPDPLER